MRNVLLVDANSTLFSELLGADKSVCTNDGIYPMDFAINSGKSLVVCGSRFHVLKRGVQIISLCS